MSWSSGSGSGLRDFRRPSTGTLSAGWYVLELVAADSGVEFDLNVRRRVEMAIKVKTAKSLASAVLPSDRRRGDGRRVSERFDRRRWRGGFGCGWRRRCWGCVIDVGGIAIVLLAQVQFMAMSAQSNVELPEAYTTFSSNFAWANLQFPEHVFGRWDPLTRRTPRLRQCRRRGQRMGARRVEMPRPSPAARMASAAAGRRPAAAAGSSAASEEC